MNSPLAITSIYLVLLVLMYVPFTLRVGGYRMKNRISLGDGGDPELLKRIRAHANFVETVPLAVVLLAVMELSGAGAVLLHLLGATLVLSRLSHYLQLTGYLKALPFRAVAMLAHMAVYLAGAGWLLLFVVL